MNPCHCEIEVPEKYLNKIKTILKNSYSFNFSLFLFGLLLLFLGVGRVGKGSL